MGWVKEDKRYALTQWPSPFDGATLPESKQNIFYNRVVFDILRPFELRSENLAFFQEYNFRFPSSLIRDSYNTTMKARSGTVEVYQNGRKLTAGTHFTYNSSLRKVRLIHVVPTGDSTDIGIVYAKYVPLSPDVLFSDDTIDNLNKKYGVTFQRVSSGASYDLVAGLRHGIDDAWLFLKQNRPLWIGGPDNQNRGSNNLIKYITPISLLHINEISTELSSLNDYLNFEFGEAIETSFTMPTSNSDFLLEETIKGMMVALNSIEDILQRLSQNPDNDTKLDKDL